MSTASVQHPAPTTPVRGATALGAVGDGRSPHRHPRHVLGNAFRAIRVFAGTTFSVAVLGEYDSTVGPQAEHPSHRQRRPREEEAP